MIVGSIYFSMNEFRYALKADEHIFGTWEESFCYLFNFKAEAELRMPASVVEICL